MHSNGSPISSVTISSHSSIIYLWTYGKITCYSLYRTQVNPVTSVWSYLCSCTPISWQKLMKFCWRWESNTSLQPTRLSAHSQWVADGISRQSYTVNAIISLFLINEFWLCARIYKLYMSVIVWHSCSLSTMNFSGRKVCGKRRWRLTRNLQSSGKKLHVDSNWSLSTVSVMKLKSMTSYNT